ncbi:MAG: hypothetical protein ACR2J8_09325, partial [Thermomicrobiales bacterium]
PGAGFGLDFAPFTAWMIPRAGLLGQDGDPSPLREERLVAGAIVTCLGEVWWLESVPAGRNGFALTAWAGSADGPKPMLAGEGAIDPTGLSVRLDTPASLRGSARHDQIAARLAAGRDDGKNQVKCHRKCHDKDPEERRRCAEICHRRRKRHRR